MYRRVGRPTSTMQVSADLLRLGLGFCDGFHWPLLLVWSRRYWFQLTRESALLPDGTRRFL